MATPEFYSGKILYPAIAVLMALSVLFGLVILPRIAPANGGLVHKLAPELTLPIAANGDPGSRMQLSSLRGHPVVLDFWASWCGPCNIQAPILDHVARQYQQRGLVVLGIDVDDEPEVAKAFALKKGLSYPIVVDPTKEASRLYDVDALPSLVVIDKEGRVVAFLTGVVDEGALNEIVSGVL